MKMKRIISVIAVIGIVLALTACGSGSGVVGTWYETTAPSETNYDNIEFKSDGTVVCEGVEGKYEVNDDVITINILGVDYSCEKETLGDHEVLLFSYNNSYYAKSLNEAEGVKEYLEGQNE